MISVWTYQDIIPKFARLDYWTGIPLMVFGNILFTLAVFAYDSLVILAIGCMILGAIFLFFTEFPTYLLETCDENGEVVEACLISIWSYVFTMGIGRHEILSGPYFDSELERLEQDLKEAEA